MGGLAELDFSLMWSDNRCILKDDEGRQIDVTVVNGCPMVTQAEGRRILEWLGFFQVHQKRKMAMVQKMITAPEEVDKSQLDLELAMTLKLRMMFPNLPEEIMMKVVPRLEAMKYEDFGSMQCSHGTEGKEDDSPGPRTSSCMSSLVTTLSFGSEDCPLPRRKFSALIFKVDALPI